MTGDTRSNHVADGKSETRVTETDVARGRRSTTPFALVGGMALIVWSFAALIGAAALLVWWMG